MGDTEGKDDQKGKNEEGKSSTTPNRRPRRKRTHKKRNEVE